MKEDQRLYIRRKGFLKEAIPSLVRKLSKRFFLGIFFLLFFVLSGFAVENGNTLYGSTSSSSYIDKEKEGNTSQSGVNAVVFSSFEEDKTLLPDTNYSVESSDTLAFAFPTSVPEKEPDSQQTVKTPQLAEVEKLSSLSQDTDAYSKAPKKTEEIAKPRAGESFEKSNAVNTTNMNSIDRVQQLINKAKEEKNSAENFIENEEQKKIRESRSSGLERNNDAGDEVSTLREEKKSPQSIDTGVNKKEAASSVSKPVRLFNTIDLFRKPIEGHAPKWERVVNLEKKKKPIFGSGAKERMPANVYKRWIALREKIESLSDIEKAKAVNRFFNQWPYKTDMELWGVEDYWEDPEEFLKKSGDCTDYAITKYYALRELGVPAEKMRIVALIDKIRGLGHAVLAFYHNETAYILDNTTPLFLEHTKFSHYDPKYSVNETYRWGHAKILRKASN